MIDQFLIENKQQLMNDRNCIVLMAIADLLTYIVLLIIPPVDHEIKHETNRIVVHIKNVVVIKQKNISAQSVMPCSLKFAVIIATQTIPSNYFTHTHRAQNAQTHTNQSKGEEQKNMCDRSEFNVLGIERKQMEKYLRIAKLLESPVGLPNSRCL